MQWYHLLIDIDEMNTIKAWFAKSPMHAYVSCFGQQNIVLSMHQLCCQNCLVRGLTLLPAFVTVCLAVLATALGRFLAHGGFWDGNGVAAAAACRLLDPGPCLYASGFWIEKASET